MVGADPDSNRWQRMKKEESNLRESLRNESKTKRVSRLLDFFYLKKNGFVYICDFFLGEGEGWQGPVRGIPGGRRGLG